MEVVLVVQVVVQMLLVEQHLHMEMRGQTEQVVEDLVVVLELLGLLLQLLAELVVTVLLLLDIQYKRII
jgi:hypothetical protein